MYGYLMNKRLVYRTFLKLLPIQTSSELVREFETNVIGELRCGILRYKESFETQINQPAFTNRRARRQ